MFRYVLTTVLLPSMLYAQHPPHPKPRQVPTKPMAMMMIDPLGVSMERMGSGTTWIPDAVPLPARHAMAGRWLLSVSAKVQGEPETVVGKITFRVTR